MPCRILCMHIYGADQSLRRDPERIAPIKFTLFHVLPAFKVARQSQRSEISPLSPKPLVPIVCGKSSQSRSEAKRNIQACRCYDCDCCCGPAVALSVRMGQMRSI